MCQNFLHFNTTLADVSDYDIYENNRGKNDGTFDNHFDYTPTEVEHQ